MPLFTSRAVEDVLVERQRQIDRKGYTAAHDDVHGDYSLSRAALCYVLCAGVCDAVTGGAVETVTTIADLELWPWPGSFKPRSSRDNLIRAAALILAEIERLDREVSPLAH